MNLLFTVAVFLGLAQAMPGALVTEDVQVFRLLSPDTGELRVSRTIEVNSDKGLDAATFLVFLDSFRSLKSFSGSVTSGRSKPQKLGRKDLEKSPLGTGLVDDGSICGYRPLGNYPFTVHYEYCINYHGGMASFPSFFPVISEDQGVKYASYTLDVPEGCQLQYYSSALAFSFRQESGRDIYTWELNGFEPLVDEDFMPQAEEMLPCLYSCPRDITLGGFKGTQSDWKGLGLWLWNLQKGMPGLSEEESARVKEMTEGCSLPSEKLAVLYSYLRQKTRYVSIQLGIGGLKPMSPMEVSRLGFGDCKALSRYLQELLSAAGVESYYYIINTDKPDLLPGYASVGQMNHAMLAVPLPELKDTAWVECTNPLYPLGYRHDSAAGHQVVLVKEDGGELVQIPSYPDTLSLLRQISDVRLSADGSAQLSFRREAFLDRAESYISFSDRRADDKMRMLTSGLKAHVEKLDISAVKDNFADFVALGRDFVPEVDIDYSLFTRSYAGTGSQRLFVPVNPYPKAITVQKSKRINELFQRKGSKLEDIVTVHIPEGYIVESVPEDVTLDTAWGRFVSKTLVLGEEVTVTQTFLQKPFHEPASAYPSFRDFARVVNRLYSASIVLSGQSGE